MPAGKAAAGLGAAHQPSRAEDRVTAELDLQLFTRRIHEWRADFGSELHWNRELGHAFIADGRGALEFIRTSLIPANKEISA